jgi:GTP 3',8-cyclase
MKLLANDKLRIIVTSKCNLNCFYCHNEGQAKDDDYLELEMLDVVARSLKLARIRANEVTVSGGEPLLHGQLAEIVAIASTFSNEVTMVSNALLVDDQRLSPLVDAGLRKLRVGVDSLSATKPRPSKGYLEQPFNLRDVLQTATALGLAVDLNVVITKFNRRELGQLAKFAVDHDLSIKFFEHVDVDEFGAAGRGGAMASRPHVEFDDFRQQIQQHIGSNVKFTAAGQFGEANVSCVIRNSEIRYCRYLCNFNLCWLTGTRVDARGYVYNCMVNRGLDQLDASAGAEVCLQTLRLASQRPCRSN